MHACTLALVLGRAVAVLIACVWSFEVFTAPIEPLKLNPDKTIRQLVHDVWGTKQGLPNKRVFAITQTPDGYLWLVPPPIWVALTVFVSSTFPQAHIQKSATTTSVLC